MKVGLAAVAGKFWSKAKQHPGKLVVSAISISAALWAIFGDVGQVARLLYAPDVIIGAVPPQRLSEFGRRDALYEFTFDRRKMSSLLHGEEDIGRLVTTRPVPIPRFACPGESPIPTDHLYKASIVVQNVGFQTANEYQLILSFSIAGGRDRVVSLDPGVRIVDVNTDALSVSYLYQQETEIRLPHCLRQKPAKDRKGTDPTIRPSPLVRETYKQFGLTRDVVILSGTLEAHLFQIVDLVLRVPGTVDTFVALYQVNCVTCRLFYRTNSYGQLLSRGDMVTKQFAPADNAPSLLHESQGWF